MHFELHTIRNPITNFKKVDVFSTLNPKFVLEKTQTACYSIIKYTAFMSYFLYIL